MRNKNMTNLITLDSNNFDLEPYESLASPCRVVLVTPNCGLIEAAREVFKAWHMSSAAIRNAR